MASLGLDKEYINLDNIRKILYIVPPIPRQAVLELTNICNLDCAMCPRKVFKRPEKHMELETYKKIIDRLGGVEEVALIGYGEPLLYPNLNKAIAYAKQNHTVSIVTNGFPLLDKKVFNALMESQIDVIRFSIDSIDSQGKGHYFNEDVINVITELREAKPETRMIINPVVAGWNFLKIRAIIDWAARHKFDQVDLARFNEFCGQTSGLDPFVEQQLYQNIKEMPNQDIKVTSIYDRYMGLRRLGFRMMTKCPMSYDVAYIRQDGGVSPCSCGLPNTVYGNLFEDTLHNIWNNQKFKYFRDSQLKICKNCTLYRW